MQLMTTVGVQLVQMQVGWNAGTNARGIMDSLADARRGDIVVTPEGSVSGYPASGDVDELSRIKADEVGEALELLEGCAREKHLSLWVGVVRSIGPRWVNEAVGFSSEGRRTYRKRNLADLERPLFERGSELPTFLAGQATIGVQICRELRFPEQWVALALGGAQLLLHMNNAVGAPKFFDVWRSMLVARAHETQRWVVSANAADPQQHCPSAVIAPTGEIALELPRGSNAAHRVELDLDAVRNDYLSQRVDPVAPKRPRGRRGTSAP
jgi:predicted amidohydrolase